MRQYALPHALSVLAAIIVALLPTPPQAEIAPDVARTLTLCATPGQALEEVVAQLGGMGWLKLPPQDRDRAGRALAPYQMVFIRGAGLIPGDWDPVEAGEDLSRLATREADMLAEEPPGQVTLMRSTGEILRVSARMNGERVDQCIVTLPGATPQEAAAILSVSLRDLSRPPLEMFSSLESGSAQTVVVDWLSPGKGCAAARPAAPSADDKPHPAERGLSHAVRPATR